MESVISISRTASRTLMRLSETQISQGSTGQRASLAATEIVPVSPERLKATGISPGPPSRKENLVATEIFPSLPCRRRRAERLKVTEISPYRKHRLGRRTAREVLPGPSSLRGSLAQHPGRRLDRLRPVLAQHPGQGRRRRRHRRQRHRRRLQASSVRCSKVCAGQAEAEPPPSPQRSWVRLRLPGEMQRRAPPQVRLRQPASPTRSALRGWAEPRARAPQGPPTPPAMLISCEPPRPWRRNTVATTKTGGSQRLT